MNTIFLSIKRKILLRRRVLFQGLLSLFIVWGQVSCITQVSVGYALDHVGRKERVHSAVTSCYESGLGSDRRIYAQVEATYKEERWPIVSTCSIAEIYSCSTPSGWPSRASVTNSEEKRNYYVLLSADEAKKELCLNVSDPPASAPRVLTEAEFTALAAQPLNVSQRRLDGLDTALHITIVRHTDYYLYSTANYLRRPLSYGLRAVDWPLTVALNAGTAVGGAVWFVVGGIPYLIMEQSRDENVDTSQPMSLS